jgi:hypothetical protein
MLHPNVLVIESKGQTQLSFTEEQNELIQQFKYIEVITGKAENFGDKRRLFQEDHLFMFIPISIISFGDGCFLNCSSLSQINLPNSKQRNERIFGPKS